MSDLNFRISTTLDQQGMDKVSRWLDEVQAKASNFSKILNGSSPSAPTSSGRGAPSSPGKQRPRPNGTTGPSYNLDTPSGLAQWDENVLRPEAPFLEQVLGSTGAQGNRNLNPQRPQNFMDAFKMGTGLGSGTGSASSQFGHSLGGMARQYLPALSIAGAVTYAGSQVAQGYNMWQQSSQPIDQLAHSLGSATQDVEQFRQQVSSAGAQFGYSMQQSVQATQLLTQAFGNMSQSSLVSLFGNTAQFSYNNGLSLQQGAQIMGSSANLGITQGYGSSLSASQFQGMLGNATTAAGMQGRQGPFYTGMLSAANSVVAQNGILANPTYFSGMYSQAVGSMGGMRGGQLFDQFNNSVMNASGYTQGIAFAAMQKTLGNKFNSTNLVSLLGAQQGGLSSFVPGTKTTLGSSLYSYITGSGLSQNQQIMELAPYFGGNVNEAKEFLRNKGFGSSSTSTANNQTTWYSLFDRNQQANANYQLQQSQAGAAVAPFVTGLHSLGFGPDMVLGGLGMRYGGSFLGGALKGGGFSGGLKAAGGKMASDAGRLSKMNRGLGTLFKRGGTSAATDAAEGAVGEGTDVAVAGGLEAAGGAFDASGIGLPIGLALGAIGLGVGGYALWKNHQHASATSSHTSQVKQDSTQRKSSTINTLTIGNLKINSISFPSSAGGSALASAFGSGTAYSPSGSSSSSTSLGLFGRIGQDIDHFFGIGGSKSNNGGSSGGGNASVPTSLNGSGNAQKVFNYLTGKGLTASAAAGIMGNLQQESGMNPAEPGGGLAQWIGARQTSLDAYAKQNGTSPTSLNTQLGFLWKELSSGQYGSISKLNGMNASQAAQYFEQMFEKAGIPDMGNRVSYADNYYQQYSKSTQTVHLSQQSVNALSKAMSQTTGLKTASGSVRP